MSEKISVHLNTAGVETVPTEDAPKVRAVYKYEPQNLSQEKLLETHHKYDQNYGDIHRQTADDEEVIRQQEIEEALGSKNLSDSLKASIRKVFRTTEEKEPGVFGNVGVARFMNEELAKNDEFRFFVEELKGKADRQSDFALKSRVGELKSGFDERTGLRNSNVLYPDIAHEISIVRREKNPCAVIMLDLDNFKQVNDTYGHAAGDMVLKTLADVLKVSIRDVDQVYRYGGEEFVILLHSLKPIKDANGRERNASEVAKLVAEKLLATIRMAEIPVSKDETINITASLGLALSSDLSELLDAGSYGIKNDIEIAEELVKSADAAAYKSKESGKDRLTIFSSL